MLLSLVTRPRRFVVRFRAAWRLCGDPGFEPERPAHLERDLALIRDGMLALSRKVDVLTDKTCDVARREDGIARLVQQDIDEHRHGR